ncbi:MAG: AAA family ATPase [Bacteroidales bacterium]|nr:AAA family ATPase [Bacteroidales bacterium]
MKLHRLKIHNIASIEDAEIDFSAEPLASSEVFLITGKTGSGKSTILDAICLALFANTPRLENTDMQGETMDGEKAVKIHDPRQLMRRNTAEACVSLTFTGSNGIHYEASWSVARARGKVNGTLQNKSWSLKNLDSGSTLSKDIGIREEMKAAIGLDFSQFCRTTMLAQGEFTRFLNSKDEEKASILEKITGVDIYSRIGRKAFEISRDKEAVYKDAQRLVEDINVLSEEEISEKRREIADIVEEYRCFMAWKSSEERKRQWIIVSNGLKDRISRAMDALQAAEDAAASPEARRDESIALQWNSTIEVRSWLNDMAKAAQEKQDTAQRLHGLSDEFRKMSAGFRWHLEMMQKTENEAGALAAFLESEKCKAEVYANAQTICGHLQAYMDGNRKISMETDRIAGEENMLGTILLPQKADAEKAAGLAQARYMEHRASCETLEKKLADADLPSLRRQKERQLGNIGLINMAKEHLHRLGEARARAVQTAGSLDAMLKAIESHRIELQKLEPEIHDAGIRMEERRKILGKIKASADEYAKGIRSGLHKGDTCPVCRQTIVTELPQEDYIEGLFTSADSAFREAEKSCQELTARWSSLNAEINSLQKHHDAARKAFEADNSLKTAEADARDSCMKCGIASPDTDSVHLLETMLVDLNDAMADTEKMISAAEATEKAAMESRETAERYRIEYEKAKEAVSRIESTIGECTSRISTSKRLIQSRREETIAAEGQICRHIVPGNWSDSWKNDTDKFRKELTEAADIYNSRFNRLQALRSSMNELAIVRENIGRGMEAIISIMPEWASYPAADAVQVHGIQERIAQLRTNVLAAKEMYMSASQKESMYSAKVEEFLAGSQIDLEYLKMLDRYSPADIKAMSDALAQVHERTASCRSALQQLQAQMSEHTSGKPAIMEGETLEYLSESISAIEMQMSEIQERKGAVSQELRADAENKARLNALLADIEAKKADYLRWSRINGMIGDASGSKFRKIAQSYVLTSLIHSANSYMKTLTDRYVLHVEPGTFVISIEDAYQGFARRAASTISGGESFLVSLSLALALSDIGQRLAVDTLFIDEGFGTLSGEALQNAVNTLRSLHTRSGRHVGIISHIEELQERIPVQIKVEQESHNSCSNIRVVTV